METIKVKLTFTEPVLGTAPANPDIYRDFIGSKAPDAATVEDEVEALGVDSVVEKGMTVFPKLEDGTPFAWDYQIKGFFKGACGFLRKADDTLSSKVKSYKKEIDGLIFPSPRKIPYENVKEITTCQRPLRAQTAQGERVSLAISEQIPAGASLTFEVICLAKADLALVREWLDFGRYSGLSQWRNAGMGRMVWDELDDEGNVIGGNNLYQKAK